MSADARVLERLGDAREPEVEGAQLAARSINPEGAADVGHVVAIARRLETHTDETRAGVGRPLEAQAVRRGKGLREQHLGVRGAVDRAAIVFDDKADGEEAVHRRAAERGGGKGASRRDRLLAHVRLGAIIAAVVPDPLGIERRFRRGKARRDERLPRFFPHAGHELPAVRANAALPATAHRHGVEDDGRGGEHGAKGQSLARGELDGGDDGRTEADAKDAE